MVDNIAHDGIEFRRGPSRHSNRRDSKHEQEKRRSWPASRRVMLVDDPYPRAFPIGVRLYLGFQRWPELLRNERSTVFTAGGNRLQPV